MLVLEWQSDGACPTTPAVAIIQAFSFREHVEVGQPVS